MILPTINNLKARDPVGSKIILLYAGHTINKQNVKSIFFQSFTLQYTS